MPELPDVENFGRYFGKHANDTIVLLSADQLLAVIKELQACYDNRAEWQEPTRE